MADKEWTVKELMEVLKQFPLDAKVYYEMGPNSPGTIVKDFEAREVCRYYGGQPLRPSIRSYALFPPPTPWPSLTLLVSQ